MGKCSGEWGEGGMGNAYVRPVERLTPARKAETEREVSGWWVDCGWIVGGVGEMY